MNKKILTLSTIVASLATSAVAAGPSVKIGGGLQTEVGSRKQSKTFAGDTVSSAITNDAELSFMLDGKASGLMYGAKIKLDANTSDDNTAKDENATHSEFFVQSPMFGKLSVGSMKGVANSMSVGAQTLAKGSGGIDGDAQYWWSGETKNAAALVVTNLDNYAIGTKVKNLFLVKPHLPSNYYSGDKISNKVSWMSPSFMGAMVGMSYTPDTSMRGTSANLKDKMVTVAPAERFLKDMHYKNVFTGGFMYDSMFNGLGVKFSAIGEGGRSKNHTAVGSTGVKYKGIRAFELSSGVSYMGFMLNGSYGDWGHTGMQKKSDNYKTTKAKKSNYWTFGSCYEYGPLGASLTYFKGTRGDTSKIAGAKIKDRTSSLISLGVDYKIAEGFEAFFEGTTFKHDDKNITDADAKKDINNKGHLILVGTKLHF